MLRLITVVGARPQFIKAAVVSHAIRNSQVHGAEIEEQLLHTGQHYDPAMSDQFFSELTIPRPSFHLGIGGGSHGANTGRMLEAIEAVLLAERPDAVMVYGDTDSTLAGALAASKLAIPLVHVEAGLRSFNRRQPEEQNRVLTDHLSDLCFAPTATAVAHLLRESIPAQRIIRCGDVMADAARLYGDQAEAQAIDLLAGLDLPEGPFILATIHRAENTDHSRRLQAILIALAAASLPVVLPLHPRTAASIRRHQLEDSLQGLHRIEPVGLLAMLLLERRAALVVTDSGGVQKEAYLQGTPCVTVRRETEWLELLQCGWNRLADPDNPDAIKLAMDQQLGIDATTHRPPLYGNGYAANAIVSRLLHGGLGHG
jgi:UDP-GlcNAc3NAcA epimerase